MKTRRFLLLLLLTGLLAGGAVLAAANGLAQFALTGGGGRSEGDGAVLQGALGQSITGRGSGGDGILCAGWPGCRSVSSALPAPILLVDDDDNAPDARSDYATVLNALDVRYHVWDTGGADNEPDGATLAGYEAVIWFSGANNGPAAGPGPAAESALAGYLDGGSCLFITAQDYIFRDGASTVTAFMQDYLGVQPASGSEVAYSVVQGQGSQFGSLGPYAFKTPLPYTAAVDELLADETAATVFLGSGAGDAWSAAVAKDGGAFRTAFWGFPLDFLARADQRAALNTILEWCRVDVPVSGLAASSDSPTILSQTTTFSATITAGTLVSYTWDFGDGQIGSGQVVSHTYVASDIYTATVSAANGANSQLAETVVEVAVPIAGLAAASNSLTALGQATAFTATVSAGDGVVYRWHFGDGQSGSGATTSHVYGAPGDYMAEVTASNAVGSQSAQTAVSVLRPVAGLEASSDSPTTLGASTAFSATITAGDNPIYRWDFGDGSAGSGPVVSHTYAAAGTYTATVTVENQVSNAQASTIVEVIAPLKAGFRAAPLSGAPPLTVTFTNLSTGPVDSCRWDFGDGASSDLCANPEHVYLATGSYTVTLTLEGGGQSDALAKAGFIRVTDDFFLYLPLLQRSGNGDRANGSAAWLPEPYLSVQRSPVGGLWP